MTTGSIKKLVSERGFGFITGNDGQDIFFHFSACKTQGGIPDPKLFENLKPGDSVEYELDRSGRHTGLRASLVSLKAYKADAPRCVICDRDTVQDTVKPLMANNKLVCYVCASDLAGRLAPRALSNTPV
jgi:CspA family cold shock protein